jgi:hypothetical protein
VPLALALLYAVVAVSFAAIAARAMPLKVLKLYPTHGPSLSNASADALIDGRSASDRSRARSLAQSALRASPISPVALRSLALLAQMKGDNDSAAHLLSAALRMTRRDFGVTMLLIEEHVRRGDLPGALRLYDIALRTSRQASSILVPNLVEATRQDALLPYLADTLAPGPDWGDDFSKMLIEADVPAQNKVKLAALLRDKRWFGKPFRQELAANLVRNGRFDLAANVSGKGQGYDPVLAHALNLQVGGDVFGWKLANSYYVDTRLDDEGSGNVLDVRVSEDFTDSPARVLLLLPKGSYRLGSQLRSLSPAKTAVEWVIECAGSPGPRIATLRLAQSATQTTFSVPADCAAQWLALKISNKLSETEDVRAKIGNVSITPASPS